MAIHAFIMTAPRSDVRTDPDGVGWLGLDSPRMSVCSDIVSTRALGPPVTVKRTFMRRVGPCPLRPPWGWRRVWVSSTRTSSRIAPSVDGLWMASRPSIIKTSSGGADCKRVSTSDKAAFQLARVPSSWRNRSALRSSTASLSTTGGSQSINCRIIL